MSEAATKNQLFDMQITEISGVDKAANKRKFLIMKRDEGGGEILKNEETGTEQKGGFFTELGKKITGLVKGDAQTFTANVAQSLLSDKFWTATDALKSAIRNTLGDAVLTAEQKTALISTSLTQFGEYIMGLVAQSQTAAGTAQLAKSGKKMSAARLEKLKAAHATMAEIIAEAEADSKTEPVAKTEGQEGETDGTDNGGNLEKKEDENDMKPEELKKAAEDAVTAAMSAETFQKGIADAVTGAISKGIEPLTAKVDDLTKRLETVEKAKGISKQADGQDSTDGEQETVKKDANGNVIKKSIWAGALD